MATFIMRPLGSAIEGVLGDSDRQQNRDHVAALQADLQAKRDVVHDGWGERAAKRVHEKGKLTTWERIEQLKDRHRGF